MSAFSIECREYCIPDDSSLEEEQKGLSIQSVGGGRFETVSGRRVQTGWHVNNLTQSDNDLINQLVTDSNSRLYFRDFVSIGIGGKERKERILVITSYRVYVLRSNSVRQRALRLSVPILKLQYMRGIETFPDQLKLEFDLGKDNGQLFVVHPEAVKIAHMLQYTHAALSPSLFAVGTSPLKKDLEGPFLPVVTPIPDEREMMLSAYLFASDFFEVKRFNVAVINHFILDFVRDNRECRLDKIIATFKEPHHKDFMALFTAIAASPFYTQITCKDTTVDSKALPRLFHTLFHNRLERIDFRNIRSRGNVFQAFGEALETYLQKQSGTPLRLNSIDFSKNSIGDSHLAKVVPFLKQVPLHTLKLSSCGIGTKGAMAIFDMVAQPARLQSLRCIHLNDNKLKEKNVVNAMCEWMAQKDIQVEEIGIGKTDLPLKTILPAFPKKVKRVYFDGTKIDKKNLVCISNFVSNSAHLEFLSFRDCSMKHDIYCQLVKTCKQNSNGAQLTLDFSNVNLGAKVAEPFLGGTSETKLGAITGLIFDDCNLGSDGIVQLCGSLRNSSIQYLSLSNNVNRRQLEACQAIAGLLKTTQQLHTLIVRGNETHNLRGAVEHSRFMLRPPRNPGRDGVKLSVNVTEETGTGEVEVNEAMNPMFTALWENQSLQTLDITGNKLGDIGIRSLAMALYHDRELEVLKMDGNRFGMEGLAAFAEWALDCPSLRTWGPPNDDLLHLYRQLQPEPKKGSSPSTHHQDLIRMRHLVKTINRSFRTPDPDGNFPEDSDSEDGFDVNILAEESKSSRVSPSTSVSPLSPLSQSVSLEHFSSASATPADASGSNPGPPSTPARNIAPPSGPPPSISRSNRSPQQQQQQPPRSERPIPHGGSRSPSGTITFPDVFSPVPAVPQTSDSDSDAGVTSPPLIPDSDDDLPPGSPPDRTSSDLQ